MVHVVVVTKFYEGLVTIVVLVPSAGYVYEKFRNAWQCNTMTKWQCSNWIIWFTVVKQIIDYVVAYKPLMTRVKTEYEEVINALLHGQHEAFFLGGKLEEMLNMPATVRNYQHRATDLETKWVYQRVGSVVIYLADRMYVHVQCHVGMAVNVALFFISYKMWCNDTTVVTLV